MVHVHSKCYSHKSLQGWDFNTLKQSCRRYDYDQLPSFITLHVCNYLTVPKYLYFIFLFNSQPWRVFFRKFTLIALFKLENKFNTLHLLPTLHCVIRFCHYLHLNQFIFLGILIIWYSANQVNCKFNLIVTIHHHQVARGTTFQATQTLETPKLAHPNLVIFIYPPSPQTNYVKSPLYKI